MHEPFSVLIAALPAAVQDGQLPNSVPGIGASGGSGVESQPAGGAPAGAAPAPGAFNPIFLILILLLVFMVVSTMMSARREKKRTAEMLSSLKRGDRVLTAGGMLGTVHEVREDSIVLRVDDVSGAKAHFTRGAIQRVIKSGKADEKPGDAEIAQAG